MQLFRSHKGDDILTLQTNGVAMIPIAKSKLSLTDYHNGRPFLAYPLSVLTTVQQHYRLWMHYAFDRRWLAEHCGEAIEIQLRPA